MREKKYPKRIKEGRNKPRKNKKKKRHLLNVISANNNSKPGMPCSNILN